MPPFRPENARNGLWRGPLARAGMRMLKRLVTLVAAIGGFFLPMMLAADAARAEKRVALIVGNSSYQTVPQLANPSRDASAVAKMFRDAGFDTVDVHAQRRQSRFQARDPQVRNHRRPGRYRRRLLCRPRSRDRRGQLPHSGRRAARQRPRCRRRGNPAGTAGVVGRWRQAPAADRPRCLPRQSLRHGSCAASGRWPPGRSWRASARSSRPARTR